MKKKPMLQVNRVEPERVQVNITTQVNSKSIRREQHNGREHLVLPSYTLPANVVMNGGLYTSEQIDKHYAGLEGTLAPLGHPTVNGAFVSAFTPEGINAAHIGAFNRNVKKSGNRIYLEKWVDVEFAKNIEGGRELIERVEAIVRGDDVPPIHTSVAAFLNRLQPNEEQSAAGADWVAEIVSMDHDAILLHEVGAATPEQGVGLMVNADQAKVLKTNSGALVGESFREREQRLDRAAKDRFAPGPDEYVWVADFTDTQAIVVRNGGKAEVYGYKTEGGKIVFEAEGVAVIRHESWMTIAANSVKKFFNPQARPASNQEGDMPLTAEEKADLAKTIGDSVAANVATQIKPLSDKIDLLETNQKSMRDTLTANARAAEGEKRAAVEAKFGKVVADSLTGNALDEMYKQCGTATGIGVNGALTVTGLTADVANLPKE